MDPVRQWLDEDEPPKHFPKPDFHQKKTMITVWWSAAGIVHYSFLPRGQTITAASYCDELDVFNQKLSELHPALVNRKRPILLHDNAKLVASDTQQKLRELGYEVHTHPTLRLPIFIFSNIWTTSFAGRFSPTKGLSKTPSRLS
jgi:histone-lysine N-methyltransferase SETMAR